MSDGNPVPNPVPDSGHDDGHADLADPDTFTAGVPHATLARLRRDDPVAWCPEPDGAGFWAVTRYADCLTVSHDVARFSSARGIRLEEMADDELAARRTLMELDPPDHTRLRRLVSRGFTRRSIEAHEPAIRALAAEVVERALAADRFDFVAAVARELPMRMLGRLLGTDDADGHRLVELGDALIGNTDPDFTDHPVGLTDTDPYRLLPFRSPASAELFAYAEGLVADRRAAATRGGPGADLVTQLLAPAADGEPITDLELKNFFTLLVAAGNDTTRYTLAAGLLSLIGHPEQWKRWQADRSLGPAAVEEILRTSSVAMHFRRTATAPTELAGRRIARGDKVVMWLISANHDEAAFPEPFRFDPARTPNDHMAFGRNGPHLCLGAWLARTEVRAVFDALLDRVDRFELDGPPARLRSNFISGIKSLPVRVR